MSDPYDLNRFVRAQEQSYKQALSELERGRKQSHWMWYVFPQFDGLGSSPTSRLYSIKSEAEARAYLEHPVLGPRLAECAEAMLAVDGKSASGDPRIAGRHETQILRDAVRTRLATGLGVRETPRQVLRR